MWLFFAWAAAASVLMALVAVPAFLSGGLSGDSSILFGWLFLAGIPAWLVVAGLTANRWQVTTKRQIALFNAPAVVGLALYAIAHLQWAQ